MQDGNRHLTTYSQLGVRREELGIIRDCPVAKRMLERVATPPGPLPEGEGGVPLAAVAVVAAADRSIATAADSVRSVGQVSVKRFAKDFDERTLAALVLTHLQLVEDMLNVARPMKPEAMAILSKEVAQMLLSDDMTLTLADIRLVADRLANGEAGQVYGGLSRAMVMKAFTGYMFEKSNAFADLREEQARERYGSWGERTGDSRAAELKRHREAMHQYQMGRMKAV